MFQPPTILPLADAGAVVGFLLLIGAVFVIVVANKVTGAGKRTQIIGRDNSGDDGGRVSDEEARAELVRQLRTERQQIRREIDRRRVTGEPIPREVYEHVRQLERALTEITGEDFDPRPKPAQARPQPRPQPPRRPVPEAELVPGDIGRGVAATAIGSGSASPADRRSARNDAAGRVRRLLRDPTRARDAVVTAEILGRPPGLR